MAQEVIQGGITDDEVSKMISLADLNGDGQVDIEEFFAIMRKSQLL